MVPLCGREGKVLDDENGGTRTNRLARAPRGILGGARDSCEEGERERRLESESSSPAAEAPLYAIDAALPHAIARPSSSKVTPLLQPEIIRQVPTSKEVGELRHAQNPCREQGLSGRREAEEGQYSEEAYHLLRRVVALVARLFF